MKNSALAFILTLATLSAGCSSGAPGAYAPAIYPAPAAARETQPHAAVRARYIYFTGAAALATNGGEGIAGVFASTANGNVAPLGVLGGSQTGFKHPWQAALDASGRLWLCDYLANAILAFPAGKWGNRAPVVKIAGSNTKIDGCSGIAISPSGTVYASQYLSSSVLVFGASSQGNAAPAAAYSGNLTGLDAPANLAFNGSGNLVVANANGRSTLVFGKSAGNVGPLQKIAGSNTRTNWNLSVAIDPASHAIVVANADNDTIQFFAQNANGNAVPYRWIAGANTGLFNPAGVAMDAAGYVYAANCPQFGYVGSILVFAPGAHGNAAPVQTIEGSKANLSCVNGIFVK